MTELCVAVPTVGARDWIVKTFSRIQRKQRTLPLMYSTILNKMLTYFNKHYALHKNYLLQMVRNHLLKAKRRNLYTIGEY